MGRDAVILAEADPNSEFEAFIAANRAFRRRAGDQDVLRDFRRRELSIESAAAAAVEVSGWLFAGKFRVETIMLDASV
jgi:hypothetical protein